MPPRWMQPKLIKLKTDRRKAYLSKPRSGGVDTSKIASHEMFQNRNRVNTTQGRIGEMEPVLNNTWMGDKPKRMSHHDYLQRRKHYLEFVAAYTIPLKKENEETLKDMGKLVKDVKEELNKDLLDLMFDVWQGVRLQGVNQFHTIKMGVYTLHFQGNKFRFVIEDEKNRYISKLYIGRDAALEAYESKIKWEITRAK